MATASAAFTFDGAAGSLLKLSTTTASATVTATIDSLDGVSTIAWSVASTDESMAPGDYTLTTSGPKGSTVEFTSDAAGTAGILQCRINGGINPQTGAAEAAYTKRAKWYVPTAGGLEVGCIDEAFESDPVYGTTGLINAAVRSVGGGSGVTSVSGTAPIVSSGGATPAISISAASGGAAGSMSAAHFSLVDGATSAATASTLAKRDADGRMKAVAGVASDDVAVVSQLGGSGLQTGADIDYAAIGAGTPQDFKAGGDGNYTIAAKTHAILNSANSAKLQLDASGLTGRDSANTNWPVIHLPLSTLAPAVSLAKHEAWLIARLRLSAGTPGGGTFLRMALDFETWVAANTATRYMYQQAGYQGGAHYLAIGAVGTSGGEFAVSSPLITDDQVVAWHLSAGGRLVNFYSLAWGGTWPDPEDFAQDATTLLSHSTYSWTPSSATLRLAWNDTTGSSAEWSMPRIQVLYR